MIATQDIRGFSYQKRDTIRLSVSGECSKEFPISYTIKECLEEYCIGQQWDFHHIQFGARLEEGYGSGRFDYYHMLEGQEKQIEFSWNWLHGSRRLLLGDKPLYFLPVLSVKDCLKQFCSHNSWKYVASGSYDTHDCGDGYLRYRE